MVTTTATAPLQICTRCGRARTWLLPSIQVCALCLASYDGECEYHTDSAAQVAVPS